jgi:hypothetical protein
MSRNQNPQDPDELQKCVLLSSKHQSEDQSQSYEDEKNLAISDISSNNELDYEMTGKINKKFPK